jgi:transposase
MIFFTQHTLTLTGGYMEKIGKTTKAPKVLFMGIDVHELTYSVSLFFEGEELLNQTYPSDVKHLRRLLDKYSGWKILAVYEAGAFGYSLYDWLKKQDVEVIVTPPSKMPVAPGERVKTDKRDARRLAQLLSGNLLKSVTVPDRQKREDRELLRTREQLVNERRRIFSQIQGKLRFHGLKIRNRAVITRKGRALILEASGVSKSLRRAFELMLDAYDDCSKRLLAVRKDILALSETETYQCGVKLLMNIPGIGLITALSFLLEMPDMRSFENNERVGSYLGLTCSEYSSGESQHQGRITRCGNSRMRSLLVQCAWKSIAGDPALERFYERLKRRRGGKRAIVAVARKLSGRMRTVLIKSEPYQVGLVQ